jgi:ABC-type transporter Mla subunit MlaD
MSDDFDKLSKSLRAALTTTNKASNDINDTRNGLGNITTHLEAAVGTKKDALVVPNVEAQLAKEPTEASTGASNESLHRDELYDFRAGAL